MTYPIHPAADVFPMIGEAELVELAKDIRANGLLETIKVCGGHVVDGRNRLRACEIACVMPRYEEVSPPDIVQYIIGLNIHRRHLTTQQRAAIAAELANMNVGDNRGAHRGEKKRVDQMSHPSETSNPGKGPTVTENQPDGSNDPPGKISNEQAAEMMNVSPASVKRAKQRMKSDPEAHQAAKRGEKAKAKKPERVQRVSWTSIAAEFGLVPSGNAGLSTRKRNRLKQRMVEIDPSIEFASSGADPAMANRIRAACRQIELESAPQLVAEKAAKDAGAATLTTREESKLERAINAHKRRLDAEYEMRIQERVKVELQIMLDDYNAVSAKHKAVIAAYKGVFTKSEYKTLLGTLHPDRFPGIDDVQRARVEKAFNLIKGKEFELCGDDGSVASSTLPKTVADLMARKKGKD